MAKSNSNVNKSDQGNGPMKWVKQNVLAVVAIAIAGGVFAKSNIENTALDNRVSTLENAEVRLSGDIASMGVKDNEDLRDQMQNEIAAYVNKQKSANAQAKKKPELKEFEWAAEKAEGNVYGNPEAKIALIEYSDFDCPFCARFHPTAKNVVNNSNGNIKWIYKHLPLDRLHPNARSQAIASECVAKIAGNKTFWAYADQLMNTRNAGDQMVKIAQSLGVEPQQLSDCMNDGEARNTVAQHEEEARQLGVGGTPATVVMNTETGKAVMLSGAVKENVILQNIQKVM